MKAMSVFKQRVKWIMLISGVVTATMLYGVVAPDSAMVSFFGESLIVGEHAGVESLQGLVMRSWSGLVGIMGLVLIAGFFKPQLRDFSLILAASSKLLFVVLVFLYGRAYMGNLAPAIALDILVVLVACLYLCLPESDRAS